MQPLKIAGIVAVTLLMAGAAVTLRTSRIDHQKTHSTPQPESMKESTRPDTDQLKTGATDPNNASLQEKRSPSMKRETAILAGGCFWGMEEILRKIPGVLHTSVGYTGGSVVNPTYKQVCTGRTGHAEGIEVVFDPAMLSYEQLLGYFFRMHDPTTLNQQHNDIGTQYRSAIFYTSEAQKQTAERVKTQVDESGKFKRPIVTEISKASQFYPGEDYHQKYLVKNPGGYNCHVLRD